MAPLAAASRTAALARPAPASTAFFLCDIQDRFRPLIHNFSHVVATARKLTDAARILDIPVIASEQNPRALGHTVHEINLAYIRANVPKSSFSMWTPEIETIVNSLNSKSAVLFGIESHVCVTQTAIDLLRNNIHVFVIADGVSSINKDEVKIALQRLRDVGATVTSSESILFQLLADASHPQFKAISNLVKENKHSTASALNDMISNL